MLGTKQFLRYCSVEVRDFKKGIKTTISDEFEIEFNYFKTLDQTVEDDSGSITIYGLTPETIAILQEEGGEVRLRCGYSKVEGGVDLLFIAYVSRVFTEKRSNISATTIECSANLLTHFFSGYAVSDEVTLLPFLGMLTTLGKSLGFGSVDFDYGNVPDNVRGEVVKFVNSYAVNHYNIGDLKTIVEYVCDYYGLSFERRLLDDADSAVFAFTDVGLINTLKRIKAGYRGLDIEDATTQKLSDTFVSTIEANENLRLGVFLDKTSGLIESKDEYQIINSFNKIPLNANERETEESIYRRENPAQKEPEKGIDELDNKEGFVNTGNSGDDFVPNSSLKDLKLKGNTAINRGMARGYTADFARILQNYLVQTNNIVHFAAFNDISHKSGYHTKGQAFDVTLKRGSTSEIVTNKIYQLAKQHGFSVKVLDEYRFPSPNTTAPHMHVSVYSRTNGIANNIEPTEPLSDLSSEEGNGNEDFYGRTPIQINRKYNRITALLNPAVKPQSLVFTRDEETDSLLTHRVRHATYKGNNKRGDWTMLLYCEDTETKSFTSKQDNKAALESTETTE